MPPLVDLATAAVELFYAELLPVGHDELALAPQEKRAVPRFQSWEEMADAVVDLVWRPQAWARDQRSAGLLVSVLNEHVPRDELRRVVKVVLKARKAQQQPPQLSLRLCREAVALALRSYLSQREAEARPPEEPEPFYLVREIPTLPPVAHPVPAFRPMPARPPRRPIARPSKAAQGPPSPPAAPSAQPYTYAEEPPPRGPPHSAPAVAGPWAQEGPPPRTAPRDAVTLLRPASSEGGQARPAPAPAPAPFHYRRGLRADRAATWGATKQAQAQAQQTRAGGTLRLGIATQVEADLGVGPSGPSRRAGRGGAPPRPAARPRRTRARGAGAARGGPGGAGAGEAAPAPPAPSLGPPVAAPATVEELFLSAAVDGYGRTGERSYVPINTTLAIAVAALSGHAPLRAVATPKTPSRALPAPLPAQPNSPRAAAHAQARRRPPQHPHKPPPPPQQQQQQEPAGGPEDLFAIATRRAAPRAPVRLRVL
eukprot:tig00020944_g16389.t1